MDGVLSPVTLVGSIVTLEPLGVEHIAGLAAAGAEDRSSYAFTWVPDGVADSRGYVESALTAQSDGGSLPFAVRRRSDGAIVGSTRFLDLEVFVWPPQWPPGTGGPVPSDRTPPTVAEIGSTWYSGSAQRTAVNSECKLLMLSHAFEVWKVQRVCLKTDARNRRSRTAIERLGAQFEGVRRVHTPASDNGIRDSAYYSILAAEWPPVRDALTATVAERAG
jgi:RimJ/RimL family protein N-acetyltransferase